MAQGYLHIQYDQYGDPQVLSEFNMPMDSGEIDILRHVVSVEVNDGDKSKSDNLTIEGAREALAAVGIHQVTWKAI
ncbi:hypothetical protein QN085_09915 [Pseudomonas sp. M2(2023)]|uniref:hypothetical protein n=1 Tax=Pseudomonas sp. M2(2023) TaxID=3049084 RepID=UPI00255488EB|nr:hypothetical protein [Pseudomonas sp. M2(2023)]WIV25881.1 hypothetical protein QN085_09915 [Pseudomonas sp. M2(2023)]